MSKFRRFRRSAGRFLRQVFHRPKAKISRGSIFLIMALVTIFFVSLLLRLEPLINAQPIVRAFDPWFQLKVTNYIAENGYAAFFTWHDDATWVPFGRNMTTTTYVGVPFTSAFFYFLLNALGVHVDVLFVSLILPAFMGALTTIAVFFLGRELSNNTVGLLSALFLAFMPAFLQRTIVGFYDNECIGVFAIVLTTLFFIRSLKRGSVASAVGAGFSLGFLQASWGASDFMIDLIAMYAFLMLIFGRYSKRLLNSYIPTISLGIFIGWMVPRNQLVGGLLHLTSFSILAPIGIGVLLAGYEIWLRIGGYREATANILAPHMRPILLGLIAPVVGVTAYFAYLGSTELSIYPYNTNPILTIGAKFVSVINPFLRLDQRIFASVAEHLPSPWSSFYNTLLILIIFFPLGMYYLFKRGRDEDWLMLLYGLTAVYFAGSMIRLGLILAPGVAVLSAVAVNNILAPFAKVVTQKSVFERRRFRMSSSLTSEHAIAAFAFIGLLLSINVILGASYVTGQVGNPEFASADLVSDRPQMTDWQNAMTYIRNVLPETAIVASWWDYGYWINGAAGKSTIVDNATFNGTQIAKMGYALMALNLTDSLKTFHFWNTTHVLVYYGHGHPAFGGDEGKWPWMVRIAEDWLGSDVIDDATYLGDNPATEENVETEYMLDAFFDSTLFKLMAYGEPQDEEEGQTVGIPGTRLTLDAEFWEDTRWTSHMPVDLHGAFTTPFTSSIWGVVKIYEIDYTMYYQYLNRTKANWAFNEGSLDRIALDGTLTVDEKEFSSYEVVFGGGFDARVYSRANGTHMYFGIQMNNYTLGEDAFGLQISPQETTSVSDLRFVNYNGHEFYDGHITYKGEWSEDTSGTDFTEFAAGDQTIEFIIPLNSEDPLDITMKPGMNYQIRFLFWNNIVSGEPTFGSEWTSFWTPVTLY